MDIRDLWDFNDPALSEERFVAALAEETDPHQRALIKTQIARTLGLRKRFEEALALLDEVDAEIGPDTPGWICAYAVMERGRVHRSSGDPEGAKPLFEEACGLSEGVADVHIDALHMVALVVEPLESIAISQEAIRLAKSSDDPRARKWLGSLLNNTAWSCHDLEDYDGALELFEDALVFRQESGANPEQVRIARWSVARCLRSLGRFEEALEMQRSIARGDGETDGYTDEEIAENLLALDRPEEAKPHFARAYELLKDDPWLNDPDRLERLRTLGGD